MHNEPNDETQVTSARILPNSLLCGRASRQSLSVHLRIAECVPVRWKQALLQGWLCVRVCVPCECACFAWAKLLLPLSRCYQSGQCRQLILVSHGQAMLKR